LGGGERYKRGNLGRGWGQEHGGKVDYVTSQVGVGGIRQKSGDAEPQRDKS